MTASKRSRTGEVDVAPEIICVDCGGRCGLLSFAEPDWGFQPGDVVAYRCADCGDRWDLILEATPQVGPEANNLPD